MEYKFLGLMSQREIKVMLIDYGNSTGIEMNNYLVRQLFVWLTENKEHQILIALNNSIRINAMSNILGYMRQFVDMTDECLTENELVHIVRENKNKIYMAEALQNNDKSFDGICPSHGRSIFAIRANGKGVFYSCAGCAESREGSTIYNPVRNYILQKFISFHGIKANTVAKELNMSDHSIYKYQSFKSSIMTERWERISALLRKVHINSKVDDE